MGTTSWDRDHTKMVHLKLNRNTDADIIHKLEGQENVQGYLKRLIREDISNGSKEEPASK